MEPTGIDPRTHITPDAFKVAPALLGTPLASPSRRALALLIDLVLAATLAELGGFFIGLAVAIVFFRVATRHTVDKRFKRWMRASLALMGAFFLFLTAFAVIKAGEQDDDDDEGNDVTAVTTMDWTSVDWMGTDWADTTAVQNVMTALALTAGDTLDSELATSDSLGTEERARAAALLTAYAEALARKDRPTLDSLQERATLLVAAVPLERLRNEISQRDQRINDLRENNERLTEEVANPTVKRLIETIANDFGLTLGWIGFYFTLFLAWWHGLTPGKRLLGLQVVRLNGQPITLWVAFERFGGYAAGVATGLLGFFQVFWDPNRQGIHDRIAGTAVIHKKKEPYTPSNMIT